MPDKKKGFGEKLKGVGKAIGRQLKKVPGVAYRDVIKPYGEHLRDKYTEPVVSQPTLRRKTLPGSAALSKAYRTGVEPYKAEERTTKATRPGGRGFPSGAEPGTKTGLKRGAKEAHTVEPFKAQQRTKLKRKPGADRTRRVAAQYKTSGGAKGVVLPLPGETINSTSYRQREAKRKAQERKAAREAALKPTVGKSQTKAETREPLTGVARGETVTVIGRLPPPPAPTTKGMTRAKPKRKFSPKKTGEALRKAAKARREQIAAYTPPDTTAQEMARMMTEQDIAREAQRTETELKGGRKPQREKARYRLRTRGLKRSEGRGR
jgi:hypothetical protein